MIVRKHRDIVLYQDVQDFSISVFSQQVPVVTDIQKLFSTVINVTLNPYATATINIPINFPYTIVNTVVYIRNLQVEKLTVHTNPDSLILFSVVSPIFRELTSYQNVSMTIYGYENVIDFPALFTDSIIMTVRNMSGNTVNVLITLEGLYSLYNLAQISPYIYKLQ